MIKVNRRIWRRPSIVLIITFILVLPVQIQVGASSPYVKIWTQSNGSNLKVTITPNSANLQVRSWYRYTVELEAVNLALDQEGFFSLAIRLRFFNAINTIESDFNYNFDELEGTGSKTRTFIQLVIPSAPYFSLAPGESLEGQLQYIIYFSEAPFDGDKSEMPPWDQNYSTGQSLGWETVTKGTITNPIIDYRLIIIAAVVTVLLAGCASMIFFVVKKRSRSRSL
ncbi:MAG: hypothetical protein ACFFD4_36510 [Candidatus Odinarchaeota archaeon]